MTTAYRYDPDKGTFSASGVPARDLSQSDFAALGPREQRIVRLADAYTPVDPAPSLSDMKRADLDEYALSQGVDPTEHTNRASLIAALEEGE